MNIARLVRSAAAALVTLLFAASVQAVPTIVVAPGTSPAGGYLGLSIFGIAPIAGVGDETITNFNVPSFNYAGQSWNQLGVVSNGYVVVGGGSSSEVQFVNTDLPSAAAPANILAPFWTDLNPSAGGAMRIAVINDGSDSWIVVDWDAVREFSQARSNSFEVWIGMNTDANPAEDITFAYGVIQGNGDGGFLTVGAQDISRTVGDSYYFNGTGTLPTEGTQLRVTTRDLPVSIPEPGTLALLGLGLAGLAATRRRKQ